ncbi:hypothetical protein chiPu_0013285 [Chiloscyllium punctatum]|uniref:Uncharacterized protein n=1 Tax=Chiloscyllium punctatum TaxID=137246 RepID=A0A401SWN9_CHIPU|nr:hypothetical protein [Chiloscyllium punctatum]
MVSARPAEGGNISPIREVGACCCGLGNVCGTNIEGNVGGSEWEVADSECRDAGRSRRWRTRRTLKPAALWALGRKASGLAYLLIL